MQNISDKLVRLPLVLANITKEATQNGKSNGSTACFNVLNLHVGFSSFTFVFRLPGMSRPTATRKKRCQAPANETWYQHRLFATKSLCSPAMQSTDMKNSHLGAPHEWQCWPAGVFFFNFFLWDKFRQPWAPPEMFPGRGQPKLVSQT